MPSSATPADKAAQVHKLCQASADKILNDFQPNLMIAIGGGGYVPARILRSFLKRPGSPNIPIQAIGLSLYETLTTSDPVETPWHQGYENTMARFLFAGDFEFDWKEHIDRG